MKIIIPSAGRGAICVTHHLLSNYLICIAESEFADYNKRINKSKILCHPDNIIGLVKKRNWILNQFRNEDFIWMFDDDLNSFWNLSTACQYKTSEEIEDVLLKVANTAEELGAYLFGLANHNDTRWYSEMKPYKLTGYINGKSIGFRNGHSLWFDERFILKHDYDISLQNARMHRYCFINEMYAFAQSKTFFNKGGLSRFRNTETEKECIKLLKQKYGEIIRLKSKERGGIWKDRGEEIGIIIDLPF